jgi:hypothetical protein
MLSALILVLGQLLGQVRNQIIVVVDIVGLSLLLLVRREP